jgi:hypothetical protein
MNIKLIQLGIPIGTAQNRLKKMLMFSMAIELKRNFCFRCASEILTVEELSIEHKIPWLHSKNPTEVFFDLRNIAFSHRDCNSGSRRARKILHGSATMYKRGCKCDMCLGYRKNVYVKHEKGKPKKRVNLPG